MGEGLCLCVLYYSETFCSSKAIAAKGHYDHHLWHCHHKISYIFLRFMTFVLYCNSALTFRYFIHIGEFYSQTLERKSHMVPAILNITCRQIKNTLFIEVLYTLYVNRGKKKPNQQFPHTESVCVLSEKQNHSSLKSWQPGNGSTVICCLPSCLLLEHCLEWEVFIAAEPPGSVAAGQVELLMSLIYFSILILSTFLK